MIGTSVHEICKKKRKKEKKMKKETLKICTRIKLDPSDCNSNMYKLIINNLVIATQDQKNKDIFNVFLVINIYLQ